MLQAQEQSVYGWLRYDTENQDEYGICQFTTDYPEDITIVHAYPQDAVACAGAFANGIYYVYLYETDGFTDELGKNKYLSRAVAKIQNEMTDEEQIVVNELCENNLLDDDNFLLKDGSIEYNPRFSNMDMSKWKFLKML